jgi:hypothetical protein
MSTSTSGSFRLAGNVRQFIVFQPVEQRFIPVSWQQVRHWPVAIEEGYRPAVRAFDDRGQVELQLEIPTDW